MRWFIFLVLITTLSNAEINEHKTDLYFANGIQNTLSDATNTWISLTEKLIGKNPNLQYKFLNYKLVEKKDQDDNINYIKEISATNNEPLIAYNQTISYVLDITEAVFQKIDLNELKKSDLATKAAMFTANIANIFSSNIDNILVDNNDTLLLTEEEKKLIKKALVLAEFSDKIETILDIVEGHDLSVQIQ